MTPFQLRLHGVLADLGVGEVVSYGEVARRAGTPGAARAVGAFLSGHGGGLPWWRVVHADGTLAAHKVGEQQRRLRGEGVEVIGGRVVDAMPPRS